MLLLHRHIHLMPVLENDLHLCLGQHSDDLDDLADGHIVIFGKVAFVLA